MTVDPRVGAVILAAGTSRRFGSPKQLVAIDGRTLPERAVELAVAARLAPVAVVVPTWLARPAQVAAQVRWVLNSFPERGTGLSLRLGLGALGDDVDAALVLLGDQAPIARAALDAVLAARGSRPLVAALSRGVMAPPVLIERQAFQLADRLGGDVGLRELLRADPGLVTTVDVAAHPPDLDTPADLDRVAAWIRRDRGARR